MKQKEFQEKMPECAAFIAALCEAFGTEAIHGQIRKGLAGEPTFWARENGYVTGTRNTVQTSVIVWDEMGISRSVTPEWVIEARAYAERRGVKITPADPDVWRDDVREAKELRDLIVAAKKARE